MWMRWSVQNRWAIIKFKFSGASLTPFSFHSKEVEWSGLRSFLTIPLHFSIFWQFVVVSIWVWLKTACNILKSSWNRRRYGLSTVSQNGFYYIHPFLFSYRFIESLETYRRGRASLRVYLSERWCTLYMIFSLIFTNQYFDWRWESNNCGDSSCPTSDLYNMAAFAWPLEHSRLHHFQNFVLVLLSWKATNTLLPTSLDYIDNIDDIPVRGYRADDTFSIFEASTTTVGNDLYHTEKATLQNITI